MAYQLTCFSAGRAEAHAVDNVVQAAFQQLKKNFTGSAFMASGLLVVVAELFFQNAVHTTDFLFFTQLSAIVGKTLTTLAVLARDLLGLALFLKRCSTAFQEQIRSFTAGQLTFWSDITCHESVSLHAAFFRRTAAIVRNGRRVSNALHTEAGGVKSTHSRFTARARTLDQNVDVFHTILGCSICCTFACYLSCERGALTRTTKTRTTGSCPRQSIALAVCDRHDRVVKRGMDVRNSVHYLLFNLFTVITRVSHVGCILMYNALMSVICESVYAALYGYARWS
ncbi:ornithine/acetylornithine aminotransferase [Zymobacter palmae]|uniref:Ornithine/acetylornithine aminotransferase n=1 Tax=Zymobacter palmae TaxID=33074 RepID=A0A348HBX3_9GAMM|nr:ornithine/acetylornithine aminotransferase [Zymobacter palmae]